MNETEMYWNCKFVFIRTRMKQLYWKVKMGRPSDNKRHNAIFDFVRALRGPQSKPASAQLHLIQHMPQTLCHLKKSK